MKMYCSNKFISYKGMYYYVLYSKENIWAVLSIEPDIKLLPSQCTVLTAPL
jgi:hypothetical protein